MKSIDDRVEGQNLKKCPRCNSHILEYIGRIKSSKRFVDYYECLKCGIRVVDVMGKGKYEVVI